MTKEEAARKKYPTYWAKAVMPDGSTINLDANETTRNVFKLGYEQAEKDFIALVKQYIEKGERCIEQEEESQIHAFWNGFHNCAENILRELEEE